MKYICQYDYNIQNWIIIIVNGVILVYLICPCLIFIIGVRDCSRCCRTTTRFYLSTIVFTWIPSSVLNILPRKDALFFPVSPYKRTCIIHVQYSYATPRHSGVFTATIFEYVYVRIALAGCIMLDGKYIIQTQDTQRRVT